MMAATTYAERRGRLQTYFDATAVEAWKQLTSDAPVSKIRQTVRQGRDEMRATLMSWLPTDLRQTRLLDAGCGTGALAVAAARRGAHVVAIDIAANLIEVARDRAPTDPAPGVLEFRVGDLLDPNLGAFAHVVAMDSLIHYPAREILRVVSGLAQQTHGSVLFTFAPRTPALSVMHGMGLLFPRANRAPAIEPVTEALLRKGIASEPSLAAWRIGRTARIQRGFYTSQAMELVRR
jgi:magnesium-protoporphyrin O-methyltransferase